VKARITIKLDMDVVAFFKEKNEKYQTAINEVLRDYMNCSNDFRDYQRETLLELALIQSLQLEEVDED